MIQSLPRLRREFIAGGQRFHEFDDDDPRRAQPLSLEQQRKLAKELLSRWRDARDWPRLTAHHPKPAQLTPARVRLADAQTVIARELGFASWARLKHHVEAAERATQALSSGHAAPLDADLRTLHIRCGHDLMYKLAMAGFEGDFLAFADPYIQGPVPGTADLERFIRTRAEFIAGNNWRQPQQAYDELAEAYRSLEEGAGYGRIAFWFEHDAYDVLVFLKLLHFYSEPERRAPDMRFLCANRYPGVKRFNGLGQLPVEAMRVLWSRFQPLTEAQFGFGRDLWNAYTGSTPEALLHAAAQDDPPLPEIIPALKRHLRELPWLGDGLGLSEHVTLEILARHGPMDAAQLFYRWYTTVYEPLPFMGDSGYWLLLDALAHGPHPAIMLAQPSDKPIEWQVSLTTFGQRLLAGKACWTAENPYDRWFGGVHNHTQAGVWHWDDRGQKVVRVMA